MNRHYKIGLKNILVKNAFLGSDYLKNTIYDPVRDQACKIYSDMFDVVPGDNGDLNVVLKSKDGQPLISTVRPGQLASFDEAIEHIITSSPQKDYILRGSQASGSGAQGGAGGGAKSTLQQLQSAYDLAVKNGDATSIVALKRRMFEVSQGQGA